MNPTQNPIQPTPEPPQDPVIPTTSQPLSNILEPGRLAIDKNNFTGIIMSHPKIKYVLVAVLLPIIIIAVFLGQGSFSDIISSKVSGYALSSIIRDEINKGGYDFTVIRLDQIVCDGGLANVRDATVDCNIEAKRKIFGEIDGPIKATVRVRLPKTNSSPMTVKLENITKTQ